MAGREKSRRNPPRPSDALRSSVLFHTPPPVRTAISLSIPKRTRKPFLRAVTPQRDACRSPCRNETPDATPNHAETAERRRIKADASRVSGRGTVPGRTMTATHFFRKIVATLKVKFYFCKSIRKKIELKRNRIRSEAYGKRSRETPITALRTRKTVEGRKRQPADATADARSGFRPAGTKDVIPKYINR